MKKKKKIQLKKTKKTAKDASLNGISEEEFLIVLDKISKRLIYKFKFGYHDIDDMKQQAAIFAMEGLKKYDHSRPLENFLWTHVRNRLFNYKRNNYQRPDKPCHTCPLYDKLYKQSNNQCSKYLNKDDCDLYASWSNRNETKKNIMKPQSIHSNSSSSIDHHLTTIDPAQLLQNKEIIDFLDTNIINSEHRETYLKLKNGCKINKPSLDKLKDYISSLMKDKSCYQTNLPENEDN
jgi:DNA-directed RNA polymerase specialized sigma subunit